MKQAVHAALGLSIAAAAFGAASPVRADDAADLIAKGKYLTAMGDCQACHTAPNGTPFAGGLYMEAPFGKVPTPNITPDKDTGIGNYTDEQFIRVFHAGIGKGGEYLYPIMPFPWYAKVTDDDIKAIKAYLFSLPPVHAPAKPLEVSFPFNVRTALAAWDAAFLKEGVFKPDAAKSAQINRGAYIVEGLEHCGECHDSRNMLGAGPISKPLQGGQIDHWYAPNITSDVRTGVGKYSDDQLFSYLKTGAAPGMGAAVGPMAQTIHESLSQLTDDDIHAVVAYLRSTPAESGYKQATPVGLSTDMPGAQAYVTYCASCHQTDGKGVADIIPALAGNGSVKNGGAETVIRVILGGVEAQASYGPMQAVGNGMSDEEIAAVSNYVRASWGNDAPANTGPGEVGELRRRTQTYLNGGAPCPTVVQPEMAKFVADPAVKTLLQNTTLENVTQTADQLASKVHAASPGTPRADVVNSLSIAYCPIIMGRSDMTKEQRLAQLNQFGATVFTQIARPNR